VVRQQRHRAEPAVLVVEDDEDTASCVSEVLASAGFASHNAANGMAALSYLAEHPAPKLILLDLYMPIMDGRRMMQVLQSEPKWRRIPVVLLTADPDAKRRAVELHATAYLKKPVHERDLLTMVDTALRYPA
jgi:two-component system chemotaxis response regulator CheY